jgi:SSS family solute:Na+ symporter
LGMWPGVWGLIVSIGLYILLSLLTHPPTGKAEEFIHYLQESLPRSRFL